MKIITLYDYYERITGLSADLRCHHLLTPRLLYIKSVHWGGVRFENHGDPSCSEVNIVFLCWLNIVISTRLFGCNGTVRKPVTLYVQQIREKLKWPNMVMWQTCVSLCENVLYHQSRKLISGYLVGMAKNVCAVYTGILLWLPYLQNASDAYTLATSP